MHLFSYIHESTVTYEYEYQFRNNSQRIYRNPDIQMINANRIQATGWRKVSERLRKRQTPWQTCDAECESLPERNCRRRRHHCLHRQCFPVFDASFGPKLIRLYRAFSSHLRFDKLTNQRPIRNPLEIFASAYHIHWNWETIKYETISQCVGIARERISARALFIIAFSEYFWEAQYWTKRQLFMFRFRFFIYFQPKFWHCRDYQWILLFVQIVCLDANTEKVVSIK